MIFPVGTFNFFLNLYVNSDAPIYHLWVESMLFILLAHYAIILFNNFLSMSSAMKLPASTFLMFSSLLLSSTKLIFLLYADSSFRMPHLFFVGITLLFNGIAYFVLFVTIIYSLLVSYFLVYLVLLSFWFFFVCV